METKYVCGDRCVLGSTSIFMMSGATLMNYRDRYNTKTYLTKRFTRVGIPFIAWSLINFIWKTYAGRIDIIWNIPLFV